MTPLRRLLATSASLALVAGAATGAATASPAIEGAENTPGGPVPVTVFNLVNSEVRILDDAGAVVGSHSCSWREPEEDDRPCIRFAGDPDTAIEEILGAGGSRARIHVTSPE